MQACQTAAKPTIPASANSGAETPFKANCGRIIPQKFGSVKKLNEPSEGIDAQSATQKFGSVKKLKEPSEGIDAQSATPDAAVIAEASSARHFAAFAENTGQRHAIIKAHASGA